MTSSDLFNDNLQARLAVANWAFGVLPSDAFDRSYLDVGFGSGNALIAAALKGCRDVTGIDLDFQQQSQGHALDFAGFWRLAEAFDLDGDVFHLIDGNILTHDFGGKKFDVISFLDVIEHVSAPEICIKKCAELLNPGGILLIAGGGLYFSHQGHHLWQWWPVETQPWRHLWKDFTEERGERIRRESGIPDWFWEEHLRLNRVTSRGIRRAVADTGLEEEVFIPLMVGGNSIEKFAHKIDLTKLEQLEDLFTDGHRIDVQEGEIERFGRIRETLVLARPSSRADDDLVSHSDGTPQPNRNASPVRRG